LTSGLDSWLHEKESAWLYGVVARCEPDPIKRDLFEKLGAAAEGQAGKWAALQSGPQSAFSPSLRARIVASLLRQIGPRAMRPVLAAMKLRGLSVYTATAAPGHAMPTSVDEVGVRHRGVSGGNLRAAIFGANDGLISNASLLLGVAGAGVSTDAALTTGIAGLVAGALSMAAGEYVSVRSQREMYEYQIALEREELREYPEEEAEELALIYSARGLPLDRAREMAKSLFTDHDRALDALAREELGLNPDDLGSPWGAAIASFLSFSLGASLPLVPFLLTSAAGLIVPTLVGITAVALALLGMAISLFTGRGAWRSALRMLLIGGGAGALAYGIGSLLGVAIG